MLNTAQITVMFASALLIAIADSYIKRISIQGNFWAALSNPWIIGICILYFIQILLAIYVFVTHGDFAVYADMYIVFYSILTVLASLFVFGEHISFLQSLGILLTLCGAVLVNRG